MKTVKNRSLWNGLILGFMVLCFTASQSVHAQIPGMVTETNESAPPMAETNAADPNGDGKNSRLTLKENPCPDPRKAMEDTPNDLTLIQEDITRFNLCLQRAQLLTRLNDLAIENMDTINSTLGERLNEIAEQYQYQPMPMPEVAMPQIPDIMADEISMDEAKNDITDESSSSPSVDTPSYTTVEKSEPTSLRWSILGIEGRNGSLVAKLTNENGLVAYARKGEKISDTDITVTDVNQTSVYVKRKGEDKEKLGWAN